MPTVFVISRDRLLRTSIRAELRDRGVEALGMETLDDAARRIGSGEVPGAVVLDLGPRTAAAQAASFLARGLPVVAIVSRVFPAELPRAAAVFRRPARVADVVARVLEILQGEAA